MTPLTLVIDFRLRADDQGGDTGTVPVGYTAYWEYDDAGCLWKNAEIIDLLNGTLREIAARQPIADSATTAVCRINVTANKQDYLWHPCIQTIENVTLNSTGKSLIKTTLRDIRQWSVTRRQDTGFEAWKTVTGTPTHYLEDAKPGYLSLYPIPTATDILYLAVQRYPIEDLTWIDRNDDIPDVPDLLREAILQGMLLLAYQKRDADTSDLNRYKLHEIQFNRLVGPPVDYRTLDARRRNANLEASIRPFAYVTAGRHSRWYEED